MKIVRFKEKPGKVFKVIPENNVVIGEGRQNNLFKELSDVCTNKEIECIPYYIYFDGLEGKYFDEKKRNHTKAKCDPKDEWDEKIGIDIASAKLDLKEHLRKARKLEKTLVTMNSLMRKMEDICQKHQKKAKAIKKDLEDYYGGIYK